MNPLPTAPSVALNRAPILQVLRARFGDAKSVLEVASGMGEHAVWFSSHLPAVTWQPTDVDAEALAVIEARRLEAGLSNLLAPARLDALAPFDWPIRQVDVVVAINMIHIAPWAATAGLMQGAALALRPGGLLFLYGPFVEANVELKPGNRAFDQDLRSRNPAWGLRDLRRVAAAASKHGLRIAERIEMPANNLSLIFRSA